MIEGKCLQCFYIYCIIVGVCGGIVEYYGWDFILVCVVWIVLILLGGFGILLYLVMWLVMFDVG